MSDFGVAAYRGSDGAATRGSNGRGTPSRGSRQRAGRVGSLSRALLVLFVVASCAASANARVNCRVHVYHKLCRGVMARRSRPDRPALSLPSGQMLRRLLHQYSSADHRRTHALAELSAYLDEERPTVSEHRRSGDSLLRRLLRSEVGDSDDNEAFQD